ncbi:MAG: TonB-dependent receptor [Perlabentimonas sp.]
MKYHKPKKRLAQPRCLLLLVLTLLVVNPIFAQEPTVTLDAKDVSMREVFKDVESQTGYSFIYSNTTLDVNKPISISLRSVSLESALNQLLANENIIYTIEGKQIVLKPMPKGSSKAQSITVKGVITDAETKETLPGVNVMLKGTTQGTTSDVDGSYSIKLTDKDPILVFSFIGYNTQEVEVKERTTINVSLEQESRQLDEVVVIGYGSESKRLLTGSIGSVSTEGMEERPMQSIDNVMQGQSAGVHIVQNSGTPGGAMSVRIRGNSSISAGSQPLYVIDGVPINTGDYSQVGFQGQGISAVSDINPNDIESISILRDASAAAIYGARASNGVVLITTKRGKSQKTKISFNTYQGFQQVERTLDMLNASQWMEYRNHMNIEGGRSPEFTEEEIANPAVDTDWLSEIFRTAPISNYELSFNGGDEKTTFFISGTLFDQKGILKGTDYQRLSGRANLDHRISDKFKVGVSYSVSNSLNNRVEGDQSLHGPLPNAITLPPVHPVYDEEGNYDQSGPYANPVSIINEAINQASSFRNIANFDAEYRLIDGLTLNAKIGLDYLNLNEHSYDPVTTRQGSTYNGQGFETFSRVLTVTNNYTVNYTKSFNDIHNFNALAGYSFEQYSRKSSFLEGKEFPSDQFQFIASAAQTEGSASQTLSGLNSWFGRLKYNYNYKYLFTINARYDGSSNFGENNQYGFFPSASTAWRISEESFMESFSALSDMKLRASFGITGNDRIGTFASLGLYGGGYNYLGESGLAPNQLPNPDLKWETTQEVNVGFDIAFFNDRFVFNADYYHKNTTDLLLDRTLPGSSGFTYISDNIGELQNQGVEFNFSSENIQGEFSWTTSLNLSANRNEITKLYGDELQLFGRGNNALIEGEPIGVFWGYVWEGIDPSTGDCVWSDLDGNGEITSADQEVIGNPHPLFLGGINNSFSYKNFDLNVFLQYSYGNDIFNGSRIYIESLKGNDNQTTDILRRWEQPGDITDIPRPIARDQNLNNRISSRFVEDGSYLRVKNVTLSYSFPNSITQRLNVERIKAYVSAQNLFTLTGYSGMDPEVNYAGENNVRIGTDFFTYPQARTFTVGLNLNF